MTEGLHDMADRPNKNDYQNTDSADGTEAGDKATKGTSPKRQIAKWISMDQIDLDDKTYHVREKDDPDTIESYKAVWKNAIGGHSIEKGTKSPFPEILVTERKDGTFVPVDGWHRLFGGKAAGLTKIYGKVVSGTHDELLKIAMQANSNNGLPMGKGDLRHCIRKVQQSHPDWNARTVAEFIGDCSPSYAAQVEKEQAIQSGHAIPEKRPGKDGREYPTSKKPRRKKAVKKVAKKTKTTKTPKKKIPSALPVLSNMQNADTPDVDNLAAIFEGWENRNSRMARVLDFCEEQASSIEERNDLYKTVKRWLGKKVNLCDNQINQT